MCYDVVFKSVFLGNENILAKMISDITGFDYSILENNITLECNELPIEIKGEKFKKCDFIVKVDKDMILNLELNTKSYGGILVKGLSYAFNLFSRHTLKGDTYNENLRITQINMNYFGDEEKTLSKYLIKEIENNEIYSENINFYVLNLVKCHQMYYNESELEIPKYVKWGALITFDNIEDIPEIATGILEEKEIKIIMDKLNKLTNDDLFMSELEAQQWFEWEQRSIENSIRKEATEQKTIDVIKSMLENKAEYGFISKVTNKTIEEIKEIEKSMETE